MMSINVRVPTTWCQNTNQCDENVLWRIEGCIPVVRMVVMRRCGSFCQLQDVWNGFVGTINGRTLTSVIDNLALYLYGRIWSTS
jgi:hypothetical protein